MDELSFLGKKMLIFITCKSPIFLPSSRASLPASQRKWCGIDFIPHDPLARALPLARNLRTLFTIPLERLKYSYLEMVCVLDSSTVIYMPYCLKASAQVTLL